MAESPVRHAALLAAGLVLASLLPAQAQEPRCTGHELLAKPRPENNCLTAKPEVYPSPDKALRAVVYPVGLTLYATPDIESRVAIRGPDSTLVTSKDFSSARGTTGYYVVRAEWSPDSQFFVFSMSSSGGHSPWSFPTWVFGREKGLIVSFNKVIGDRPTTSEEFRFSGPSTVVATTWDKPGSDGRVSITVDLAEAIKNESLFSEK
jgi:hypothetical protein